MRDVLTVTPAAKELTEQLGREVTPRELSLLFYRRAVPDDLCPVVAGRRLIPRSSLAEIAAVLQKRAVKTSCSG